MAQRLEQWRCRCVRVYVCQWCAPMRLRHWRQNVTAAEVAWTKLEQPQAPTLLKRDRRLRFRCC